MSISVIIFIVVFIVVFVANIISAQKKVKGKKKFEEHKQENEKILNKDQQEIENLEYTLKKEKLKNELESYQKKYKYCNYCGTKNEQSKNKCDGCGANDFKE